ncbi:MAG: flagellar basal body protein [Gemmataceae bacterium]|nr:flagellar basal body protein [Gemmataceae bacterium]
MNPTGFGIDTLSGLLSATGLRHRVIAQNVANVNTPGYRRLEVTFGGELARATGAAPTPKVVYGDGPARVDGNTVDIDREMNDLAKNALLYQAAAQIVTSRLASLRSAVSGR